MNAKRIAAIIGLAGIGGSILCLLLSGLLPAYKDALQSLSAVGFLLGATVAGVIWLRSKQANQPEETPEE